MREFKLIQLGGPKVFNRVKNPTVDNFLCWKRLDVYALYLDPVTGMTEGALVLADSGFIVLRGEDFECFSECYEPNGFERKKK